MNLFIARITYRHAHHIWHIITCRSFTSTQLNLPNKYNFCIWLLCQAIVTVYTRV